VIGVSTGVSVDEIEDSLAGLAARVGDLQPVLDEVGGSLVTSTLARFEAQHGPDEVPWRPLAETTLEKRAGKSPSILRDSGRLAASVAHLATRREVRVGTNVRYARIHQLGGHAGPAPGVLIPARPYLGLSAADRDELLAIVRGHLEAA
jgi:phage virion morphogenesis protein